MNPSKKYSTALIKTIFTHITILGLLFSVLILYRIARNIEIDSVLSYINSIMFYANNLILFLIIGIFYFVKAKKTDNINV